MKKFLISVLLTLLLFPLFAETKTLGIKGYYKAPTNTVNLVLEYKDPGTNSYVSSVLRYVDIPEASINGTATEAFRWKLTGTSVTKDTVTLSFEFTVFQALVGGYYYRPAYTISMEGPTTTVNGKTGTSWTLKIGSRNNVSVSERFAVQSPSSFSKTKDSISVEDAPNGYIGSNTITCTGAFYHNRTGTGNYTWERTGSCKIVITDSESTIPGNFEYTCEVRVNLTAN